MIAESLFSIGPGYGEAMLSIQENLLFDTNLSSSDSELHRNDLDIEHELQQMNANLSTGSSVAESDCSSIDDVIGLVSGHVDDVMGHVGNPVAPVDSLMSFCETLGSPLIGNEDAAITFDESLSDLRWDSSVDAFADKIMKSSDLSVDDVTSSESNGSDVMSGRAQLSANNWNEASERTIGEELSHIICTQLDLRQQLEVLRIIDPLALHGDLAHMDLEDVSEDTLEQVRTYITHLSRHSDVINASRDVEHKSHSKRAGCDSTNAHTCHSTHAHKRQTKKERREKQRLERQRRQKEARQIEKERRSGLFRSEQVLSLSRLSESRDEAEEEVDIFT